MQPNHKQLLDSVTPAAAADLPTRPHDPIPICATNDDKILPRRYVLHRHSQACTNCGRVHEWSQVYAFNEMMTRTGAGRLIVHLIPIEQLRYNLPIEQIEIPTKHIPVCVDCAGAASLSHLPDPRSTQEWKRIYSIAPLTRERPKAAAQSTRQLRTIDDII